MGERGKERREGGIRRKEEGNCLSEGRVRTNEMGAGKEYGERDWGKREIGPERKKKGGGS